MGKPFINDDFMLSTTWARQLYHEAAESLPIIDYHCHLSPQYIAEDRSFSDMTELWLGGDHYKWRQMRANGVPEKLITGDASSWDKFQAWAETMPRLMRNPLYHWSHLELSRVFGINEILKPETARSIYDRCNEMLRSPEFSCRSLIRRFNVETLCTTDDPVDSLEWHDSISAHPFGTKVLPAWRPDKAVDIASPGFTAYVERLSEVSGKMISDYDGLISALKSRHDYFDSKGCRLSDHGLDTFYAEDFTYEEADRVLRKALSGDVPSRKEAEVFKSALLFDLAVMDAESGWVQQFHVGPLRNNFTAMFRKLGPDTGYDGIGDLPMASAGYKFLDSLASKGLLAKTILYNLNPKDSETFAVMAYTFNDGVFPGKMQYGAAWWFLDSDYWMREQLETLSSAGMLSRFVGMLTDSRSFISYPRHEYFRRILCDVFGEDLEKGKLPVSEMETIKETVSGICYGNARDYFGF